MGASVSQYFQEFQTSEAALQRLYKTVARQMAFTGSTRAQAQAWQKKARKRFAERLGLDRFALAHPRAKMLESVQFEGLTRETWRMQTERDVWTTFYMFLPPGDKGPRPLVLCPHGHSSAGKWSTGGRRDIAAMNTIIDRFNYDYGLQIARAGFITVCCDARGFGERREPDMQNDRDVPNYMALGSCHQLSLAGAPLGITVQGMWTWDLMLMLDHLAKDPRVDASRIGCAGLSGGGLQTLDLAALDTRVKAAVVSGYFYGVRESLLIKNSNCMCNMVPRLWEDFDMGDIGALVAPRGLFIETGDEDPLNGRSNLANVRSQVKIARQVYAAYGSEKQLQHHVFHGEHKWDGTQAIPWLMQQLQPER